MAPVDRRVRVWSWMVRRQASLASLSEAGVIKLQARRTPSNALANRIFGTAAPSTVLNDRTIPGPAGCPAWRADRGALNGKEHGR